MSWITRSKRVMLLATLALFVAACGVDDEGVDVGDDEDVDVGDDEEAVSNGDGELSGEEITLEFPSWQANEPGLGDAWQALIDEFEDRYPNVSIDFYHISNAEFQDRIVTRLVANDPPDIVVGSQHLLAFAATGQLEPLSDQLEEAGILDDWQALQSSRIIDGEHYALMTHSLTRHLHVNMDYLGQVGIDEPPSTPEELLQAARAMAEADLGDVAPYGATTTDHSNVYSEATTFVIGMGSHWAQDGEWTVTSPETVEAVEVYRELARMSPPGQDGGGIRQLLADGQVAMLHDGNWVLALLDDLVAPERREDIVAAVSPFEQTVGYSGASLSIPREIPDAHKEYVWEFIKMAAEPEMSALWALYSDAAPGHVGALTDEMIEERPELQIVAENLDGAVDEVPDSQNIRDNFGEVEQRIIEALMRLLTSDAETLEVLEDLEQELAGITEP